MDIKIIREDNSLDAVLSVNITMDDIRESCNKNLRIAKQKMTLPGFRKGKVPETLVKNYYWESIVKEELEKKLEESITNYFKENDLDFIKPLLPIDNGIEVDLKNFTGHEFSYNIGLTDKIEINESELLKDLVLYNIRIDEKDLDDEIEKFRKAYGRYGYPETIENIDEYDLHLEFSELNGEGEIMTDGFTKKIHFHLHDIPEKFKELLLGKKKDEAFDIRIDEVFESREVLANLLSIDKLVSDDLGNNLRVKVLTIFHLVPAEISDLYTHFPSEVNDPETLRNEIRRIVQDSYKQNSEQELRDSIYNAVLNGVRVTLPEKFTDQLFLKENSEKTGEKSNEEILKEKEEFAKRIKWSVISNHLSKKYNMEVTNEEIINETYYYFHSLYARFGIQENDSVKMSQQIRKFLENPDNTIYITDRIISGKIIDRLKSDHQFESKEISLDDFKNLKLVEK